MTFPVKDSKSLSYFLLNVAVLVNVFGHQIEKFVETDASISILVNLPDHFLQISLSGVPAKSTHNLAQLNASDRTSPIPVKEGKNLPVLLDFVLRQHDGNLVNIFTFHHAEADRSSVFDIFPLKIRLAVDKGEVQLRQLSFRAREEQRPKIDFWPRWPSLSRGLVRFN